MYPGARVGDDLHALLVVQQLAGALPEQEERIGLRRLRHQLVDQSLAFHRGNPAMSKMSFSG